MLFTQPLRRLSRLDNTVVEMREIILIERLWIEFVKNVREDSGVVEQVNFLGSVEKHKVLFMKAAQTVMEEDHVG